MKLDGDSKAAMWFFGIGLLILLWSIAAWADRPNAGDAPQ